MTDISFPMDAGGYRVDILFHGFPGKSLTHGGLGWSTVVLLRGHGHTALLDTGPFGYRKDLLEHLKHHGLKPADITDLVLSHAHHDHIINYLMFPNARPIIGSIEMNWAIKAPWGVTPIPELYVRELQSNPRLKLIDEGDEALPNLKAWLGPGHTPGHLIFVLDDGGRDIIFLQDSVKTRAELVSRETDMTYDAAVSASTVEKVWGLWRKKPGSIVVPGHDMPFMLDGENLVQLGKRPAVLRAVFGDSLADPTLIDLAASS